MAFKLMTETYQTLSALRQKYQKEKAVFISGKALLPLLQQMGAKTEDIAQLESACTGLPIDPTLPFRRTKQARFISNEKTLSLYQGEIQPYVLSKEEGFKRFDSGQVREFPEMSLDLTQNTLLQALLLFKLFMIRGIPLNPRPLIDYDRSQWHCNLFQVRTVTTPELIGEPALEGVHCDGVDHTMTTFLQAKNMREDSAATAIHDFREESGKKWDETDPSLKLGEFQHRHFLDTILLTDNERKHSLSSLRALNEAQEATRDMLIFFSRRPTKEGHISFPYDSQKKHEKSIVELTLGIPETL